MLDFSVSLSGRWRCFLENIHAAHNCLQRLWSQTTGLNYLSVSIIYPFIYLIGSPRVFCNLYKLYLFPMWGSSDAMHFPLSWFRRTLVGSSQAYMSAHLSDIPSIHLSVHPSVHLLIFVSIWSSALIVGDHSHGL